MSDQNYQIFDPSSKIPTREAKANSRQQKAPYTGKSTYQILREAEKKSLIDFLEKEAGLSSQEAGDFVYGIPNAKWTWANTYLKRAFSNGSINPCDTSLFNTIWLSDSARNVWDTKLVTSIKAKPDANASITAKYPSKGDIAPVCKAGNLQVGSKNPGVYNMYTGKMEYYPTEEEMFRNIIEFNQYDDRTDWKTGISKNYAAPANTPTYFHGSDIVANPNLSMLSLMNNTNDINNVEEAPCSCEMKNDRILEKTEKTLKYIDVLQKQIKDLEHIHSKTHSLDLLDVPPHISSLFANFRRSLVEENKIDINQIEKVADSLKYLRGIQTSSYLMSIVDPFNNRFIKAPSEIPIPSASFSVRTNINLTTNNKGNLAFAFDPFFLNAVTATSPSSFGINNNDALTGLVADANFVAVNVGQTLPAQLYGKYRLVSAGLKLSVTSSFLNTTGFCTMGLQFDSGASAATNLATNIASYANYGQFQLLENSYFKQQAPLRTGEIIQLNYLPLDNTFLQFASLGSGFKNCTFVGYVTGAPVTTTIGRLDIVLNYEGTVDLGWTDYIPQAISFEPNQSIKYLPSIVNYLVDNNKSTSPNDMKNAIAEVVDKDKTDIIVMPSKKEKNLYDSVIDTIGNIIDNVSTDMKGVVNDNKSTPVQKKKAKGFLDIALDIAKMTPIAPIAYAADFFKNLF